MFILIDNFLAVNEPHSYFVITAFAFSALTLLVGRQEEHPACKKTVVGCWQDYLSAARCRLAYGPADAIATHCVCVCVCSCVHACV